MKIDDIEEEEEDSTVDPTGMAGGINARTLEAILRDQKDRQRRYEKKSATGLSGGGGSNALTSSHRDGAAAAAAAGGGDNSLSPQNHNAALPLGWERIKDPENARVYYYNRETQEMSWDPPVGTRNPRPGSVAYERSMRIILEGAKRSDLKHAPEHLPEALTFAGVGGRDNFMVR